MTTNTTKLLNQFSTLPGASEISGTQIVLAVFGYTAEDFSRKRPVKNPTFRLTRMATPLEFNFITTVMRIGGFAEVNEDSPALVSQHTDKATLDQFGPKDLSAQIFELLENAENGTLTIDKLREAYAIATHLRAKRIRDIAVCSAAGVLITAAVATGLYMVFGHSDEAAATESVDDDVILEDPIIVDDEDNIDYGDLPTSGDSTDVEAIIA